MSSRSSSKNTHTQLLVTGLLAAAALGLALYLASSPSSPSSSFSSSSAASQSGDESKATSKAKRKASTNASASADASASASANTTINASAKKVYTTKETAAVTDNPGIHTPKRSNVTDEKELHSKIEELDKKGKALFKKKQYLEAASTFTEALDCIEQHNGNAAQSSASSSSNSTSNSLTKQIVTLINNRSAMYEKGNLPELAIADCETILEVYDRTHTKARQRKCRILETKTHDYYGALVECCAMQLQYMQQHRDQLRMGLPPSAPPPVQQEKLEELVQKLLPEHLEEYDQKIIQRMKNSKKTANNASLPSDYTLRQLLKSYTGFVSWMEKARAGGSVSDLEEELETALSAPEASASSMATIASLHLAMGRRHICDGAYKQARTSILKGFALVQGESESEMKIREAMKDDDYARLLEWTGMVQHWAYELDAAVTCYQQCAQLEPINAEILVKHAGVLMDANRHADALELFDRALAIDPNAVDALLHRANLRMIQGNMEAATKDLKQCVKLRPNFVMARLRLAAVLTALQQSDAAKEQLDAAERADPDSSDVLSYKGELLFTQNDLVRAKLEFERASELDPSNPTPYVNTALAVLNLAPEPGKQLAMAEEACRLLEKAIAVDPQFQAAYVQLGQLKLGMASDLSTAREVVDLYEKGLSTCRTKDEMKDLMGMKLLTQAQVDGAKAMKLEAFSHQ